MDRRAVCKLLFPIAFVAPMSAWAQGQGNGGNGQGNGSGSENSNAGGNGNGNAGENGQGNGNSTGGNSNGNGGGSSTGNANSNSNGNSSGSGGPSGNDSTKSNQQESQDQSGAAPVSASENSVGELSESEVLAAVKEGRAVSLSTILPDVRSRTPGKVIDAQLEQVGGLLLYGVTVLTPSGKVVTQYYNAGSGVHVEN